MEQKRKAQLIEDSINATRAAIEEGIVPGGGVALMRVAPELDGLIKKLKGAAQQGATLVQRSLSHPFACIVANSGRDSAAAVAKVAKATNGHGFDARSGETVDMVKAGIIDPGEGQLLRGPQRGIGRRLDPDDANPDRQKAG